MIDTVALRKKILDFAISGRLTHQLLDDGNAKDLYDAIQDEKALLIKGKVIKKTKALPKITTEELPFEIPNNWMWARWGDLSNSIQYGYNAPAKSEGRIKMIRISDIQDDDVKWDSVPYCDINESDIDNYLLKKNDILFARTGGTVGKSFIVSDAPEESIFAGYLIRTSYSDKLSARYMKYFMDSDLYWKQLRYGMTSTAQPNCNGQTLSKMIVPIPPLEEQKRIVDIVDKAFEALDTIDELQSAYSSNLEVLKSKIIDAGIQGKLTAQLPEDGNAEDLYAAIQEEKERLIKEKKIKKSKTLPEITEEEMPFEIPDNWKWVKVEDIAYLTSGKPYRETDDGELYIKVSDMNLPENEVMINTSKHFTSKDNSGEIPQYSIIFPKRGGAIATNKKRMVIDKPIFVDLNTMGLTVINKETFYYIKLWFDSLRLDELQTGTAIPQINNKNIYPLLVPLPPLAEQNRIVKLIESLLRVIY